MKTTIAETLVEWDDNKNQINIRKHGISFETAALVFADEERIEYFDRLHSQDEDCYVVLGCVQGILYVVYTMRNEAARIISARMATPLERRIYYGEFRITVLYSSAAQAMPAMMKYTHGSATPFPHRRYSAPSV